ncbi:phage holin family protein [Anseongella ginsenosidimutans]|nr:phage holin family protein [Anseongella ginsenosidimutans]
MQEEKEAESTLFEEVKEYISVRSKIFSLQVAESAASLVSNLISNGAALLFFIIFFVFASIGLAFLVAQWVGNTAGGFFIVAAFYLLIGVIIWMIKDNYIERPLTNIFIRNLFKGKEEDEENI